MAAPDSISLAALAIERARLADVVLARNTQRGYLYDWNAFLAWARSVDRAPLPATSDTVALHLTSLLVRGLKVSSCGRRASAIAHMHRACNLESPVTVEVRRLLYAARRTRREAVRRVMPLSLDDLRAIARVLGADDTPIAIRDRAILVDGLRRGAARCQHRNSRAR
jgi:site-specific recombinase XerD